MSVSAEALNNNVFPKTQDANIGILLFFKNYEFFEADSGSG